MPTVEFDSTVAAETLLRAAVLFKFEGGEEAEIYAGSPHFAHSVNRLLDGVVQAYRASGKEGMAQRWENLYQLARHDERRKFVRDFARKHPDWETMSEQQRMEWVDVIAAPYKVSDNDYPYLIG